MRVLRQFLWAAAALAILPVAVNAQDPVTLSGSVQSDLGAPLASASVYIESMNLGTLTNEQGRFMLIIPASRATGAEAVVTASLIGFTTVTEVVTLNPGTINLNFSLATDPLRLDEIIVTGVGLKVEHAKLGVTINEVSSEEIDLSQEYNIVAALAGKVPNVEVTTASGEPGSGTYIRIRGANSLLGDNQPIFVVDRHPIDKRLRDIETSTAGTVVGTGPWT